MFFSMIGDNNVFNIRYNKRNKWIGQRGQKRGFCCFDSRDNGIRACFVILVNYIRSGYDTYRKIINRFAPSSENDTEKYLEFVCNDDSKIFNSLIDPDKEVAIYDDLLYLMTKMAMMENGVKLSKYDILKAIKQDENDIFLFIRIKLL